MKKLWTNCHIATMQDGQYSSIESAAIVTLAQHIHWIGAEKDVPVDDYAEIIDLNGAWVTPGLIDCHTHSVFGGNRSVEFEKRLQGVSYAEIAASGGGIASTVRATREASEEQLLASALKRIRCMLKDGVTTIEIKSGYGLDYSNERKMLRVIRQVAQTLPMTVKSTCLAAHALPPEYQDQSDAYIEHICTEMLPKLHQEGLVDAVDAFCEHLAFSPAQVERVFKVAQALNLPVKLHAEQLSSLGGSTLAARYHALSADHLEYMTEADAKAMAASGTVAVLLPGAFYFLRETKYPPLDSLQQHGVRIALSSDLNPGTSPALSLRLMLNMGSTLFRLTPEQALAGVTTHAAYALGLQDTHGTLEQGKVADFIAWDIEHPSEIVYWLGGDLSKRIIQHGNEILISA
ncbi:imidazolonepropionase [Acinetobacter sp. RIT698]|uniref:imidazolonepropionase n=1 Tax=Acinetobacter TaxID=469 RepID=UPI0006F52C35|nr:MULTISPECIES: imidazolonepropionase [Acinetobacter]KQW92885.1 imidazolonepropionase [Acinetobacter sp. Root1280]MCS4297209.1 imidazolonepropionase [Acinetobacter guillouiae]MCU4492733.1 imidazolonepropionase [Acinetobacter guillouiae]MCW2250110.1 imidazolonepropionase [Acinetobacter sp. BIGb0204]MRT37300.1 imidazolonepropionase [Acinetobacter sp. RIT698]